MNQRTEYIRKTAKKLLAENTVDCVIGFKKGSLPLRTQVVFARTPGEADQLEWSGFCTSNPANFLRGREGKTAVVAQGCASRNIAGLIQEKQVAREDLHIIGVPCLGMLDRRKIEERAEGEILEAHEEGGVLVIKGKNFEQRLPRFEVMRDNCLTCLHRNPVIYDELAAEPDSETFSGDINKEIEEWEKLSPEDRKERFQELIKDCIRCYACRDACPLCYCSQCFVDESGPQWCGKTQDEADVATFHVLRAFHCAGRCTDCGACESACPVGIKVRLLTGKLEKDVRELYGFEPGMDEESLPPLSVYRPEDPEEFVK